jgi:hypothetical protein
MDLTASIERTGMLSPPVLLQKEDTKYDILCGRRRLKCVSSIGASDCLCRILPEPTSPEEILSLIIEDQYAQGSLSVMEQAFFITLCHTLIAGNSRRKAFLHTVPAGRITKGNHFLLPLATFHQRIQEKIHLGIISERIISDLLRLDENDQLKFLEITERLQISGNNQKKVIVQLTDILRREAVSLESLLLREEIKPILDNEEMTGPQKSDRFLEQVLQMSRPLFSAAQKSFEEQVKEMKLPDTCSLSPSRSFEKDEVILTIRFKSLQDLNKHWLELRHYLGSED